MNKRVLAAAGFLTAAALTLAGCGDNGADRQAKQESAEQIKQEQTDSGEAEKPTELAAEEETQNEDMAKNDSGTTQSDTALVEKDAAEQDNGEEQPEPEPVQLKGTTVSILGDSISTFEGYQAEGCRIYFPQFGEVEDVKDTWWQQVTDDLELTLFANSSSAGATVTGDSTGTDDPQCGCNEFHTDALAGPDGACPDRIIVYLGANDLLETVPLGDNDGTRPVKEGEITAFSDAYTLLLDKLQKKYPSAQIYCCTLPHVGDWGTQTPFVELVNGLGLSAKDYGRVIAKIAKAKGLPVIDLYHCGIKIKNMHEVTSDGVHPTAAGMDCIADAVKEAVAR